MSGGRIMRWTELVAWIVAREEFVTSETTAVTGETTLTFDDGARVVIASGPPTTATVYEAPRPPPLTLEEKERRGTADAKARKVAVAAHAAKLARVAILKAKTAAAMAAQTTHPKQEA